VVGMAFSVGIRLVTGAGIVTDSLFFFEYKRTRAEVEKTAIKTIRKMVDFFIRRI
jgi:hypothetical protein